MFKLKVEYDTEYTVIQSEFYHISKTELREIWIQKRHYLDPSESQEPYKSEVKMRNKIADEPGPGDSNIELLLLLLLLQLFL